MFKNELSICFENNAYVWQWSGYDYIFMLYNSYTNDIADTYVVDLTVLIKSNMLANVR